MSKKAWRHRSATRPQAFAVPPDRGTYTLDATLTPASSPGLASISRWTARYSDAQVGTQVGRFLRTPGGSVPTYICIGLPGGRLRSGCLPSPFSLCAARYYSLLFRLLFACIVAHGPSITAHLSLLAPAHPPEPYFAYRVNPGLAHSKCALPAPSAPLLSTLLDIAVAAGGCLASQLCMCVRSTLSSVDMRAFPARTVRSWRTKHQQPTNWLLCHDDVDPCLGQAWPRTHAHMYPSPRHPSSLVAVPHPRSPSVIC